MRDIRIAAAQFENKDGDKEYNLSAIERLTKKAVNQGAEVVSFHEACIPGYTFIRDLNKEQMLELSETLDGSSVRRLIEMAGDFGVHILAGLLERDKEDRIYNTYVCVNGKSVVAHFRKLHAFINPHLTNGNEYCVFDLDGVKCGILICFDNNIIENVRCTTMLGAEVIFMPHVTGCLPSPMPGRGIIDPELWDNRHADPVRLRQEFDGPKGRGWLLKWLPARAYDNGIYAVFTNPVGIDGNQVRNGNSMIIDPYGEIMSECRELGDDVVTSLCSTDKIDKSSGKRYLKARRPELFGKLTELPAAPPVIDSGWGIVKEEE